MKVLNIANIFDFLLDWYMEELFLVRMISHKPSRTIEEFLLYEMCRLIELADGNLVHPIQSPFMCFCSV